MKRKQDRHEGYELFGVEFRFLGRKEERRGEVSRQDIKLAEEIENLEKLFIDREPIIGKRKGKEIRPENETTTRAAF